MVVRSFSPALPRSHAAHRQLLLLGLSLVTLQILDGVLTGVGVSRHGYLAEANVLLRALIVTFGVIPALIVTKVTAIAAVIFLAIAARQISWGAKALRYTALFYLVAAVCPWVYVLVR